MTFGYTPCDISLCAGIGPQPTNGNDMQCAVGGTVTAPAQTIVFWISCRATRRAATAVLRQALSTRRDSIMPLRLLGVTVRLPANAAWAAFCASRSSFFPALYDDHACPAS